MGKRSFNVHAVHITAWLNHHKGLKQSSMTSLLRQLSSRVFYSSRLPRSAFCTTTTAPKTINDVNELFAEARLCLQDALESKGTVYFADDFADAKEATKATLVAYNTLLESSTPDVRTSLVEANRPKMAQLEEEFKQLEHELIHDE